MSTCRKFNILDQKGKLVMVLKFYDKIADLLGKDGYRLVGSKMKKVIGATREIDEFQSKIRKAKSSGITRVEVSFCFDDSLDYTFGQPYMNNLFHINAKKLMDLLVDQVINDHTIT